MSTVLVNTFATPWRKVRSVNQTSAAFVSKINTPTEPAGDAGTATGASVIDLTSAEMGGFSPSGIAFNVFGIGTDTQTLSCRVIGWRRMISDRSSVVTPETNLWIPTILGEFACLLTSGDIGVANKAIIATELFADTITLVGTTANAGVNCDITNPQNDTKAYVYLDLKGHQKVEFSFAVGTATSGNALWSTY